MSLHWGMYKMQCIEGGSLTRSMTYVARWRGACSVLYAYSRAQHTEPVEHSSSLTAFILEASQRTRQRCTGFRAQRSVIGWPGSCLWVEEEGEWVCSELERESWRPDTSGQHVPFHHDSLFLPAQCWQAGKLTSLRCSPLSFSLLYCRAG